MKFVIFFAFIAMAMAMDEGVGAPQYQLHIPDKCEDVLAVKVCERLVKTAESLKLKAEDVKNAVVDAYKNGKQTATEIRESVEDFLANKVMTKKCEDFTTVEICQKLRKAAADAKVQAQKVKEYVLKQLVILRTKSCEDYLDAAKCTQLKNVATKLKIKAEQVKDMLVDAYLNSKDKAIKKLDEVYTKIKDYVMATKCEDMFNPGLCENFRKYAEKTKIALPKIMETAVSLVIKGYNVGKALVEKVFDLLDYFYDCTDVFDQGSCDRLKKWAAKIKVTAEEVEILVRKYVRVFIEKTTSIYGTIKKFVTDRIYCHFRPKSDVCTKIPSDEITISKRSILGDWRKKAIEVLNKRFPNLENNLRKYMENIITKSKSLWQFMRTLAKGIKSKGEEKLSEFLKKFMVEM